MKRTVLLLTVLLLGTQSFASDISASYSNSSFEEIFHVDRVTEIEMWQQPKTQYTPKNLVSEQQMRFNGKEGTNSYNSYTLHLTDYDTKITKSYFKDGKFYIEDNTGKAFQTGELIEIDTSALEAGIQNNTTNINNLQTGLNNTNKQVNTNTQNIQKNIQDVQKISTQVQSNSSRIQANTDNIKALNNNIQRLDSKVDRVVDGLYKLDDKVDKGLATVTALTSLHPNPRYKGKTQVAIGTGMYNNNVAGAIGVFHYLNDNIMLNAGVSYGGSHSWAGNVGISIGF